RRLTQPTRERMMVVAQKEAIVRVEADAARMVLRVGTDVSVEHHVHPLARRAADLISDAGELVELRVRLPAVDDPDLDLEAVGWEDLYARAVEEPGRIVRGERRLIRPILEVHVREQAHVRHEYAGIDIDAV